MSDALPEGFKVDDDGLPDGFVVDDTPAAAPAKKGILQRIKEGLFGAEPAPGEDRYAQGVPPAYRQRAEPAPATAPRAPEEQPARMTMTRGGQPVVQNVTGEEVQQAPRTGSVMDEFRRPEQQGPARPQPIVRQKAPTDPAMVDALTRRYTDQGMRPESARTQALMDAEAGNFQPPRAAIAQETPKDVAETMDAYKGSTALGRGIGQGRELMGQQALGVAQLYADVTGDEEFGQNLMRAQRGSRARIGAMGESKTPMGKAVESATASIMSQLPALVGSALAPGVATGTAAALGAMGVQSFSQEYLEGRASGLDPVDAGARASLFAAAEVIGERFGLGAEIRGLKAAARGAPTSEIAELFGRHIAAQIPGEQVTTTLQMGTDVLPFGLNQGATLEDYLRASADTLLATVVQGGVMGAGAAGLGAARRPTGERDPNIADYQAAVRSVFGQTTPGGAQAAGVDQPVPPSTPAQAAAAATAEPSVFPEAAGVPNDGGAAGLGLAGRTAADAVAAPPVAPYEPPPEAQARIAAIETEVARLEAVVTAGESEFATPRTRSLAIQAQEQIAALAEERTTLLAPQPPKAPDVDQSPARVLESDLAAFSRQTGTTGAPQFTVLSLPDAVPERARVLGGGREGEVRARLELDAVQRLAEATGSPVHLIRNDNPDAIDFNGVVIRGGEIYLSVDAAKPLHGVFGHEFSHRLERQHPEVWAKLWPALQPLLANTPKYRASRRLPKGMSADAVRKEIIGDLFGNEFMDAEFHRALARENPSLYRRVADALLKFIDSIAGTRFAVDDFVIDLERARGIIRETMAEFVANRPAPTPQEGAPQQSRKEQTETPEFKRWFGESKVVDAQGRPLVVYHGAPDARFVKDSGVFMPLKRRLGMNDDPTGAFWFASDRRVASTYADDRRAFDYQRAEPGIISAYLRLENPLIVNANGANWRDAQRRGKTSDVIEEARAAGNDGVIIRNVLDDYSSIERPQRKGEATDTYVVFRPEQIKSATENRGTFDPADERIQFSAKEPAPIFFSELARQIANVKIGSAPVAQWKGIIQNLTTKGVKKEEIQWSGVLDWLDLQKGKVAKADVEAFLAGNGVQVEETQYGGDERIAETIKRVERITRELKAMGWTVVVEEAPEGDGGRIEEITRDSDGRSFNPEQLYVAGPFDEILYAKEEDGTYSIDGQRDQSSSPGGSRYGLTEEDLPEIVGAEVAGMIIRGEGRKIPGGPERSITGLNVRIGEASQMPDEVLRKVADLRDLLEEDEDGRETDPKYASYTLPGGENYREVLLTLPSAKDALIKPMADATQAWRDAVEQYGAADPRAAELKRQRDAIVRKRDAAPENYRSTHWGEPNVLAHIRVNDRTDADGARVLFVEEIQSDFGQSFKKQRDAVAKAVDSDFEGIVERMKAAGVLKVECD